MEREPEIRGPVPTTHALVPAPAPRMGRVARWVQRVTGLGAPRPADLPSGLMQRVDALERRVATHEEDLTKRLEESEGRVLNWTQQRFKTLEADLNAALRKTIEREMEERTALLRRRLSIATLLALAGLCVAGLALYLALSGGAS